MSKLQLPDVTLFMADSVNPESSIKVIEHCKRMVDFGDVKLLTHKELGYEHEVKIPELKSLIGYSIFMLTKAHKYFDTKFALTIQRDGWILNPQSWDNRWLDNHYTAPLFQQYDVCGSGGFSLRSKKIMEYAAKVTPEWDFTDEHAHELQKREGYYEDGKLSFELKRQFKIASLDQAADFGQGGSRNPRYFRTHPFGYHRTWQQINFKTGYVDSSDTSRDITQSYDADINSLSSINYEL